MSKYLIKNDEIEVFTTCLYSLERIDELVIIGKIDLKYYRMLIGLRCTPIFYKSNKEFCDTVDNINDTEFVFSNRDLRDVMSILQKEGVYSLNFDVINSNGKFVEWSSMSKSDVSILAKKGFSLWTELFYNLESEIRLIISAEVETELVPSKQEYVDINFENETLVPTELLSRKEDEYYRFSLGSTELLRAERRFIKGSTFNIRKVRVGINSNLHMLLVEDESRANGIVLLKEMLNEDSIKDILERYASGELIHIYYKEEDLVEKFVKEFRLEKISRRWEY